MCIKAAAISESWDEKVSERTDRKTLTAWSLAVCEWKNMTVISRKVIFEEFLVFLYTFNPSEYLYSHLHCVTWDIWMINPAYFTLLVLFTHGSVGANGMKRLL